MPSDVMDKLKEVLLNDENPAEYFEMLRSTEQLRPWFAELKSLIGMRQRIQTFRKIRIIKQ